MTDIEITDHLTTNMLADYSKSVKRRRSFSSDDVLVLLDAIERQQERIALLEAALVAAKCGTPDERGQMTHYLAYPDCGLGYVYPSGKVGVCDCWIGEHDAAIDRALSTSPTAAQDIFADAEYEAEMVDNPPNYEELPF